MAKRVTNTNQPIRPLAEAGAAVWNAIPRPATRIELEALQLLCEQIDERDLLRQLVLAEGDNADRRALRDLEHTISAGLARYSFAGQPAAAPAGTREQRLVATRDQLAMALTVEIDSTKRAALTREYRLVLDRIEELMPAKTESKIDELSERRAGRNTVTSDRSAARTRDRKPG